MRSGLVRRSVVPGVSEGDVLRRWRSAKTFREVIFCLREGKEEAEQLAEEAMSGCDVWGCSLQARFLEEKGLLDLRGLALR